MTRDQEEENSFYKPRWIVIAILGATLVVAWPLFLPWVYDTHDGHYAFYNAAQFDLALRDGQLPVRWLPDLFGGRGLPHFVYYHPLVFYLTSVLNLTGMGFIASVKTLYVLSLALSGFAMYRWLRSVVVASAAAPPVVTLAFALATCNRWYGVTAATPARATLNLHDFPGWRAWIAGDAPGELDHEHDDEGRIVLSLPEGKHRIQLRFERTAPRMWGGGLSLVAMAAVLVWGFALACISHRDSS